MSQLSDGKCLEELLCSELTDDEDVRLDALYEWWEQRGESFVFQMVRTRVNHSDWQDTISKVLLTVMEAVQDGNYTYQGKPFEAYVSTIVKRVVFKLYGEYDKRKKSVEMPHHLADDAQLNRYLAIENEEMLQELWHYIQNLIPRRRQIIILWLDNWSLQDIADELGVSYAVVSRQKGLAIDDLRRMMKAS